MIILVATFLRLTNLGTKSLWLDESYHIYESSLNWHDLLQSIHHPFGAYSLSYHLFLRYWLLLGNSEAAMRGLSVLFGVVTVLAVWRLGAELFDSPTGLIAAALVSSNALLIQYSQEICAYTLTVLLAVLSSLYFFRALQNGDRGNWAGYTVTSILMLYSHVLSILVVAAHVVALFVCRRWMLGRRAVVSLAAIGAGFVLLAWCLLFAPPLPRIWLPRPTLHNLQAFVFDVGGPNGLLLGCFFVFFALLSLGYMVGQERTPDGRAWRYLFLLLWAFLPPLLLFALSQWKPLFISRYLLPSVSALLLLVAAVVRHLKRRWLAAVCVAAMLLLSIRNSTVYLQHRSYVEDTDDWRDATAYLVPQVGKGDVVVLFAHHERFPFQYYRDRYASHGFAAQVVPAGSDEEVLEESRPIEGQSFASTGANSYDRVWLMYERIWLAPGYAPDAGLRRFRELLAGKFQTTSERHFGNIELILYARPPSDSK